MRLRNVSLAEDDVLMTIDEMATEPFRFGALDDGTVVMARGGVTINGLSLMPMGSDAEYAEFLERLRARGVDALVMDMKLVAGTRIVGPELEVFYVMGGDMRGLGSFELDIEVGINSSLYAQLVPQLQDPDSSSTALLGMTSAAYLRSAGLVYHDTGIGDIILEIAAEEDGFATEDMRPMMRLMLAESIRSTFPENASWMLPPLALHGPRSKLRRHPRRSCQQHQSASARNLGFRQPCPLPRGVPYCTHMSTCHAPRRRQARHLNKH